MHCLCENLLSWDLALGPLALLAQSKISVALVLSHELCRPLLSPNHLAPATPLAPSFYTSSLHPTLGWNFTVYKGRGGCEGRTVTPISCGESGPQPQPGSRASLWWATQGQRVQENMQNFALNRQRRSSRVLCSQVQAENARIDMLNGCKERNSSSRSWVWGFSPRWRKERWRTFWSNFNWHFSEEEAVWPWAR